MKAHKPAHLTSIKIEKHREVMDQIFLKMGLKSFDDWLNVSNSKLRYKGANKTLLEYQNDVKTLLKNVYPNYPWNFESNGRNILNTRENQLQFMEILFYKLNLQSLEDWKSCSQRSIRNNGGTSLFSYHFDKDLGKLLTSLYPNYPWKFHPSFSSPRKYFSSLDNKKNLLNEIFCKLELTTLDDWLKVSISKIQINGGECVLSHYKENMKNLLPGIYPNYPWNSCETWEFIGSDWIQSIQKQQKFMHYLFKKFNLQTIDNWLYVPILKISQNGGERLVSHYEKDIKKLLLSIYPQHNWNFDHLSPNQNKSIDIRRRRMDLLYNKLKLQNLDDWCRVSSYKFDTVTGKNLLTYYYKGVMRKLLNDIYPNYPWDFDLLVKTSKNFDNINNRRLFMDNAFTKLKLQNFDDWLPNQYKILKFNGGRKLLQRYNGNFEKLFTILYPNYSWNFYSLKENQLIIMEKLFKKFNLKTLDDWLHVARFKITKQGGKRLLHFYNGNFHILLKTLYPNHLWEFDKKNSPALLGKFLSIIKQYSIRKKNDWYRVNTEVYHMDLIQRLEQIYPDEKWRRKDFYLRAKKSVQRLLYSLVESTYLPYFIIENYHHPLLLNSSDVPLEYDIFIPALNLAFEYQGEQHFDDMPVTSGSIEHSQIRDQWKVTLSEQLSVKLILIPFWWDKTLSTLLSALNS